MPKTGDIVADGIPTGAAVMPLLGVATGNGSVEANGQTSTYGLVACVLRIRRKVCKE